MSTEKVNLITDTTEENVTSAQPQAGPPGYTPAAPQVMVKGNFQLQPQRPVDPDMNTIYLSIFTMLFCCWPCGLVGLIYGIQGMQQYYRGQYDNAESTSRTAKTWTICGIVSGVIYIVSIVLIIIVGGAARVVANMKYSSDRYYHHD